MAKKTNYLLLAAVAVGGYFLWKRSAQPVNASALPPQPGTGLQPMLSNAPLVSAPAPAPTGFLQTVTAQAQPAPTTAAGTTIPADIYKWIGTLDTANQAQAQKALQIMPQSEVDSLEDIVHNDFYGNGITTDAQRTFWNMWRVKYHVLDGTYA